MGLRHCHRHAAEKSGKAQQSLHDSWRPAENTRARCRDCHGAACARFRSCLERNQSCRDDRRDFERRVYQHRVPPAEHGDGGREHRGPDRAGEVLLRKEQRHRAAAPAVEPARNIDIERRVDAGIAEKADANAVRQPKRRLAAEARQRQPERDHQRPADHHRTDANPLGRTAYDDPAERRAEVGQREGERRYRARATEIGRDRLQRNDGDVWRADGHRGDADRGRGREPGSAGLDHALTERAAFGNCHARTQVQWFVANSNLCGRNAGADWSRVTLSSRGRPQPRT